MADWIDRMFQLFELRERTSWKAVFGEAQQHGETTVIPVAAVTYAFGMGLGRGEAPADEAQPEASSGEGGGGGGGGRTRPIALIEIGPTHTRIRPVLDWTWVLISGFAAVVALTLIWSAVARQGIRSWASRRDEHTN